MMTNKMDRFSPVAKELLVYSKNLAVENEHEEINSQHMLLAMTHLEKSDAFKILRENDIIHIKLIPFLKSTGFLISDSPIYPHPLNIQLALSDEVKRILELSVDSARRQGIHFIGTASLLIGMMRRESKTIDSIVAHFDVQRKDIIKLAEDYAVRDDNVEKQSWLEYLAQQKDESKGCIASILDIFGISKNKNDAE